MDGMKADLAQCVDKVGQGVRRERRGQDDEIRRTEIERLVGGPRRRAWMLLQKFFDDLHHSSAYACNIGEFTDVHAGQLFRQNRLVAGRKNPMRNVVGKALQDRVIILESLELVFYSSTVR